LFQNIVLLWYFYFYYSLRPLRFPFTILYFYLDGAAMMGIVGLVIFVFLFDDYNYFFRYHNGAISNSIIVQFTVIFLTRLRVWLVFISTYVIYYKLSVDINDDRFHLRIVFHRVQWFIAKFKFTHIRYSMQVLNDDKVCSSLNAHYKAKLLLF